MSALTDFLTGIADAIRAKKGTTAPIPAANFAAEIASIAGEGGGSVPVLTPLEVTENGEYLPNAGVDGFSSVKVNVETSDGEEPVLEPLEVTENGTYEPQPGVDGFSSVTVNVEQGEGGSSVLKPLEVTQNGVYIPGDGVDGFSQITVNVPLLSELDYFDTSGEQHIKTGIYPSSETKIEIKVRRDTFSDQALFGSRKSTSSSDRFVSFMSKATTAHCQFYNQSYDVTVADQTGMDVVVELSKDGYYYNGELITEVPQTAFTSSYELYLFAMNQANAVNRPITVRFYYCKMWQSDVLVRDFVPILLAGSVVCLYDKVNDKYYFNSGSGDFTAGPVKE